LRVGVRAEDGGPTAIHVRRVKIDDEELSDKTVLASRNGAVLG
jgi:hypothetical protein